MGLRDLIKKKDKIETDGPVADGETYGRLATPEVTFIRSDTFSEEVIHPPGHGGRQAPPDPGAGEDANFLSTTSSNRRSIFSSSGRQRGASVSSRHSTSGDKDHKPSAAKRLSQRLHLSRSPSSSENVPQDLPEIVVAPGDDAGPDDDEGRERAAAAAESQWEKRATILARENERARSRPPSPGGEPGVAAAVAVSTEFARMNIAHPEDEGRRGGPAGYGYGTGVGGGGGGGRTGRPRSPSAVSSKAIDEDIQEAIRLHESENYVESTRLFGRLADPNGANNPLSQVLYGLALRHGWGCEPDPEGAVRYLSKAAANAAEVENLALQAGMKKGGAAKGELVLAIFELANCFRHGWGVPKDPIAAKQYYETAANLGDTDAMNEVAWCYLEGYGTKKDKFASAKYYRLAEKNGNKTLGNSWIWKEKYDPGNNGKK